MKKVYLVFLMLVVVALTASATKRTRLYDFTYGSNDYNAAASDREFQFTSYTHVSFLAGYSGRTGQQYKTENVVQGYDNRFAFYNTRWHWRTGANSSGFVGYDNQYLKNDVQFVNLFSVLNLRAGDIVRIKCNDNRTSLQMKERFITAFSPNAIDNRPWAASTDVYSWLTTAYHEFIMKEDGNLDLNCAPYLEIVNVEVISPFANYQNKTVTHEELESAGGVLETGDIYINPWGKDRGDDGDPKIVWQEWKQPIVLLRGDLEGTPVATKIDGQAQYSNRVRVSGISGRGGTVVVMLERCMYTFTIPYQVADGSKGWNFWSNVLNVGRSSEDGSEGPDKLSLQAHDNAYGITARTWNHGTSQGNVYLTYYNEYMNGQNAYLNEETAGLVFWSETNGDTFVTEDQTQDGGWQRRTYAYENENLIEDGDGNRYLAIFKNGGFTIPDLKAGDQVYIYMGHSDEVRLNDGSLRAGIKFHVWNACDALKKPIGQDPVNSGDDVACGGSPWGPSISTAKWARQYYGALHFYAYQDGDMSFRVDGEEDRDYIKLYYIRIYRNEQDIITNTDELLGQEGYELLLRQNPDGTFKTPETRTFNLRTTNTVSKYQQFEVLECSGNLTKDQINGWSSITKKMKNNKEIDTNPTVWNLNVSTTTPLYGAFLLRGKDMDHNNTYCVNYADRVVAIGTLQQMNYPYTWNFADIIGRGASSPKFVADAAETTAYQDSTRIWTNNSGNFELNNSAFGNGNRNWSSGAQLFAYNEFMEEAAGVGFATWNQAGGESGGSRNGDITITADGVKILPQHAYGITRVFVPNLKAGQKLFIQGKRYSGGVSGFKAQYLTGKADVPRVNNPWNEGRYHDNNGIDEDWARSTNPLLSSKVRDMNIILGEVEEEVFANYAYNFSSLDIENRDTTVNVGVDEHLTVFATDEKPVTFTQGTSNTVSNSLFQYSRTSGNEIYANIDGTETLVRYVDEYGNITFTEDAARNDDGDLVYDSDNVTLVEDENTYSSMLKLNGSGGTNYRVAQITGLDAGASYDIIVVAKSQKSSVNRELKIYGGNWGGTELATMLARNKVMSKSITVSGQETITIGSADNGIEIYAIYVKQSGATTTISETPFIAYIDMDEAEFYSQDATNVTLYLSDVLIEHMAVSMDEKKLNAIGWASESRQRYIDHSLNEVFNDVPVKAYLATGTGTDEETNLITSIRLTEVTSPMELSEADGADDSETQTGCILHNDDEKEATISLFVPAIHDYIKAEKINQNSIGNTYVNTYSDNETFEANRAANVNTSSINSMENNMMMANLNGTKVPYSEENAEYCYYVLSYKWTDPQGITHPTEEELENGATYVEKFVRVATSGATMNKNSAYIRLPQASVNPHFQQAVDIIFDGEEGNLNGITDLTIGRDNGVQQGESDSYYTLSGQKINKPTVPGIYVKNGKKVYVK